MTSFRQHRKAGLNSERFPYVVVRVLSDGTESKDMYRYLRYCHSEEEAYQEKAKQERKYKGYQFKVISREAKYREEVQYDE